eukprot:gene11324-12637_t
MGNCSQQANSENTDIKEASSKRTTDNSPSSATANSNNNDDNNDKSDKMKSSLPQPNPPPYSKGGDKNASKDLSPPKPPVGGEERKGRQETLDKAASRIQRQIRKTHSVRAAKAAQQWKLFADLDTQDEAEMLHLAVFMQTLIDTVPGVTKTDQDTYIGTSSDPIVKLPAQVKENSKEERRAAEGLRRFGCHGRLVSPPRRSRRGSRPASV